MQETEFLFEIIIHGDASTDTKEIKFYKEITAKFKELISKWKEFRSVRSMIEDVFKLAKKTYSMEDLHRYTRSSVQQYCSLAVLLVGITVNYGIKEERNCKPSLNKEIKRELYNFYLTLVKIHTHNFIRLFLPDIRYGQ